MKERQLCGCRQTGGEREKRGLKRGGGGGGGQTGKKFDILKTKTTSTATGEERSAQGQSIPSQFPPPSLGTGTHSLLQEKKRESGS